MINVIYPFQFPMAAPLALGQSQDSYRCQWSNHERYVENALVLTVREITKNSSTFYGTNISSNIAWFLQLHDTIQMKSNYTWINYNHDNIAIRSHLTIYNSVWNLFFGTKFSSIISQKEKNVWFFDYHLLTCSVRKTVIICLVQNINMCLLHKSHQIACLVSHLINHFSKWMFTV